VLTRGTPARVYKKGRWRQGEATASSARAEDIRIATWNVWFGGHMFEERGEALLSILEKRRPHVIALQEVTPALLERVLETPWVREDYRVSDIDLVQAYDVLMLSSLPVADVDWIELPSRMGRRLLAMRLACGLVVGTVHLESTDECAEPRADQLGIVQPALLAAADDVVLVGDFNFSPHDDIENAALDSTFVDVWAQLHPREPGHTVDSHANKMRHGAKGHHSQKRIDRIFVSSSRWRPRTVQLLGTQAIDITETFVSDHFGLEASFEVATEEEA
jgi:tyrosyl-DNA phosphodiesterase 2